MSQEEAVRADPRDALARMRDSMLKVTLKANVITPADYAVLRNAARLNRMLFARAEAADEPLTFVCSAVPLIAAAYATAREMANAKERQRKAETRAQAVKEKFPGVTKLVRRILADRPDSSEQEVMDKIEHDWPEWTVSMKEVRRTLSRLQKERPQRLHRLRLQLRHHAH
jgi:hypothetical protein